MSKAHYEAKAVPKFITKLLHNEEEVNKNGTNLDTEAVLYFISPALKSPL